MTIMIMMITAAFQLVMSWVCAGQVLPLQSSLLADVILMKNSQSLSYPHQWFQLNRLLYDARCSAACHHMQSRLAVLHTTQVCFAFPDQGQWYLAQTNPNHRVHKVGTCRRHRHVTAVVSRQGAGSGHLPSAGTLQDNNVVA